MRAHTHTHTCTHTSPNTHYDTHILIPFEDRKPTGLKVDIALILKWNIPRFYVVVQFLAWLRLPITTDS